MNAVLFFRGIEILAKYQGTRTKQKGDPDTRVRWHGIVGIVSDADNAALKACGYIQDGNSWYCDT